MRMHTLEHVPFEGPANIGAWAKERGHMFTRTFLYEGGKFPHWDEFDWLVVMGGPMNIYEVEKYPWLIAERNFIEKAIAEKKIVLGVCLGAQLIADILGGSVYKNHHKEIGWFPVQLTEKAKKGPLFAGAPECFTPFHWHGETFDLPPGCTRLAESEGCSNQAFEYKGRVIGLQFHLESTQESIKQLIDHCGNELVKGQYIQTKETMLSQTDHLLAIEQTMTKVLDNIQKENTVK